MIKTLQQKTIVLSFLFSLSLAIETIISKIALNKGADPLIFSVEVLFFTALFLGLITVINLKKNFHNLSTNGLVNLALSGIIGLGLGAIIGKYGLKLSTAINYGFLFTSTLIFSTAFGFFLFKEKLGKNFLILSLLFVFGSYLLITNGRLLNFHLGDLLIILSAFCLSCGSAINKIVMQKGISALTVSFIRVTAGFIFWLIIIAFLIPQKLYLSFFALAFIQSLFSVASQLFMNNALKIGNISLFSLIGMSLPLFTAVFGIGLLKESLSLIQAIGAIIIFSSCIMLVRKYK
ncbi:hypothetical protein A3J78_01720 [Candidatus Beckwithbacteria bacterium RBG_13_35_6]|uniref:EamA domain-containing protein n=1 Tax=Candidatus Beckwithbacteria bacterium RBG_13_35_6 TaxID=1797456 RepID=A0A1F5DGP8_9BACT|nr:MAG: hypothetical protein A3J78_01720 [Candidatus Beckwithbacteria bacterium RBG_13_35_6]